MNVRSALRPLCSLALLFACMPASAAPVTGADVVRGDPAAESIVTRLQKLEPAVAIEVLAKRVETHPVTGYSYTLLKVRLGQKDVTAAINRATGEIALDRGLPEREAGALLARLPSAYGKMATDLIERVRRVQGGVPGGEQGLGTELHVLFYADSAEGLDEIQRALGGAAATVDRFDAVQRYQLRPPVVHPDRTGTPTPVPPAPRVFAIGAKAPLSVVLRVGSLPVVTHLEPWLVATPRLDVSVPRVNGDDIKGFGLLGADADIGIVDTGLDDTHPNLPFVIAESDFTEASQYCEGGANDGVICVCTGGACVAGACDGGESDGAACVAACAAPGVCEGPEDDTDGHGTHVAGIAGNDDAGFEGMAPLADLINAKAIPGNAAEASMGLVFARGAGADVINGSYGVAPGCTAPPATLGLVCIANADCDTAPGNGVCGNPTSDGTSQFARDVDHEVFQQNRSVIIAAEELPYNGRCSNAPATPCANAAPCPAGGVCLARASSPNDAFNVITVGASNLAGPPSTTASFSQVGPTADGRSKPDVLAPGEGVGGDGIDSTAADWEGAAPNFVDLQGTSMAAPHVAGLGGQLWDWGDEHGMLTDTPYLKAAILNNANRLAGWARPSNTQPLDTAQGTGEINALETFRAYADDLRVWQQRVTGTDPEDSHWYWIDVTGAPIDVVVTLAFERHAANPAVAGPALNDLDLKLYDPDSNLLDESISVVDSVEHIVFNVPQNGRYCIEVDPFDLTDGNAELYALAVSRPPAGNVRDFRLNFLGTTNPCVRDFGDAPDPFTAPALYPTKLASIGARHFDWTKEWLGTSRFEIDGELVKGTLAVHSVVDPFPSVSGENDAIDPADEDGIVNLIDSDFYDDGVFIPGPFFPLTPKVVTVTVQTTVDDTGFGPNGRYESAVPTKRLYLNAWADWDGNGSWGGPGEKIIGTGSPTGQVSIDPETFGANGRFTIGETFSDDNGSGAWEPTEPFVDIAGVTEEMLDFIVIPPGFLAPEYYLRFRLDYGEDVGNVADVSGNLKEEVGEAQFGEVEDYPDGIEVDVFPESLAVVDVRFPAGSTTPHQVELSGPTIVHVDMGSLGDPDADTREQFSTEMVYLQLSGTDPMLGTVIVRLRDPSLEPFQTTVGEIEESFNYNSGQMDLPPFVTSPPGLSAGSTFDVFFEVELVDQGVTLHNHVPKRMRGTIYYKPPGEGDNYLNFDFIPLFDASHAVVAEIGPVYHTPRPPRVPHEIDLFPESAATVDVRFPIGSMTPNLVNLTGPSAVDVDLGAIADPDFDALEQVPTRMILLDLHGSDPSFGDIIVRQRPSGIHPFLPTLGEIEENVNVSSGVLDLPPFTTNPPGLTADTYFNVFLEVELPNLGLTLHSHTPKFMSSNIRHKPPAEDDVYVNLDFITLFDDSEQPLAEVGPGQHVPFPGPTPTGPPGVTPTLRLQKLDPTASVVRFHWSPTPCNALNYELIFGGGSGLPAGPTGIYNLNGGMCQTNQPPFQWNGVPPVTDPRGFIWFLVVAHDNAGTEGSWGRNSFNQERRGPGPNGSSGVCNLNKDLSNDCGQTPP